MAWIYLAVSEESPKPSKDTSSPSPIARPIGIVSQSFYPAWQLDSFLSRQFGMTYDLCKDMNCPFHRRSSTVDSLARTFQSQDAEMAWKESAADYFSRSFGLSARYDPDSSSWRTSQQLLFEAQNESLESFVAFGMTVDGGFYPLKTWARITDAIAGGSWRTPDANMERGPRTRKNLEGRIRRGMPLNLNDQLNAVHEGLLPTPRAGKTSSENPETWIKRQRAGKVSTPPLAMWAKMWPTPRAADADKNIRTPEGRAKERLRRKNGEDLPTAAGGQLNPTWVEWLMGYPSEWTVLEDWATQWFRPRREKRLKD
jgi:hypothetical protein